MMILFSALIWSLLKIKLIWFSAAVAKFVILLSDSEFEGNAGISQILELDRFSKGEDEEG